MKFSIKIALFSIAIVLANTCLAQKNRQPNPEEIIGQQMEKIEQVLNLDDLQAVMVKNTLVTYAKERVSARQSSDKPQIIRVKMEEIKEREHEALSKFLDEDQLKKLKDYQKSLKEKRRMNYYNQRNSRP